MSASGWAERDQLIELVRQIMMDEFLSEEDTDRAAAEFEARVPHPEASGLIFHPMEYGFDSEPSPEDVVDRALAYRPFQL